jgi:3-phenylpropionate/trans-cinnamate dioxygenase ferredoxin subunit
MSDKIESGTESTKVRVTMLPEGPFEVVGEIEMIGLDGQVIKTKKKCYLCRCGASTHKPFCDGTHSKAGFEAAAQAVPESKEN